MELHPEDSVGFVNAQGLPSEQTTEVTTNVIVRDGETILIGGLFREVTTDTRRQVPGLAGIPVVGALFQSREDKSTREEVIILLTVHIVKDPAAYAAESLAMYENLDRLRVGVRQGLMWHGRERVAQRHYHRATDAFAAGDTEKALWHLNMALHNHPRLVPAMELKEQIRQQREWDEDASGGRLFLFRLLAKERGRVEPLLGRPGPPFEEPEEHVPLDDASEDDN
jgi:type IV pilus assembly protein PilQ